MTHQSEWNGLKLGTPATYRIRVQGRLDQSWSDRMSGMSISSVDTGNSAPVTILVGYLNDQAALAGVLNALYNLHMPLISVENIDERREQQND